MVTTPDDQVRKPSVELDSLRDFRQLHQLTEVIDLGTDCEVVVSELVSTRLQLLGARSDVLGDLEVLLGEVAHLVAELGSFAPSFDFDLTCESLELVDVPRTNFILNREQLQVELLLIVLLEESNQEFAGLEYLGAQHSVQEALVVLLTLDKLARCLPLGLHGGKWWDHHLRVGSQKEIAQDLEVGVQAFDAPLHRERVDRDHHRLVLGEAAKLRGNVLVNASNDAACSIVARKDGLLSGSRVASTQNRRRSAPLQGFIKHIGRAVVQQHRAAS